MINIESVRATGQAVQTNNLFIPWWIFNTCLVMFPNCWPISMFGQPFEKPDINPAHILLIILPLWFKFYGNFILISIKFYSCNRDKFLHMPWQLCCHGMCKILLWSDSQKLNYLKLNLLFNSNYEYKIASKMVPLLFCQGLDMGAHNTYNHMSPLNSTGSEEAYTMAYKMCS